jgi:type II secretory pathway component PulK
MIIPHRGRMKRARERGSAVIILIMLLGIMTMYIAGNAAALYHLKREILLAEQRQERARVERIRRLSAASKARILLNDKHQETHGQNPHD